MALTRERRPGGGRGDVLKSGLAGRLHPTTAADRLQVMQSVSAVARGAVDGVLSWDEAVVLIAGLSRRLEAEINTTGWPADDHAAGYVE